MDATTTTPTPMANCRHCGSSRVQREGEGIWNEWMDCEDCGYMTRAAFSHQMRPMLMTIASTPLPKVFLPYFDVDLKQDFDQLVNLGWLQEDVSAQSYTITEWGEAALKGGK